MLVITGIAAIVIGMGVMGFGLLLFYAFLRLFYGMAGAGLGYWVGVALSGSELGSPGIIEFVTAIIGGAVFLTAAYALEEARRLVTGLLLGAFLGISIGAALGADNGVVMFIFAGVFAIGGAVVLPLAFDPVIMISSGIAGAALIMDGVQLIFPDFALVNRTLITTGDFVPLLIWIVLAAIGLGWQLRNFSRWITASETT